MVWCNNGETACRHSTTSSTRSATSRNSSGRSYDLYDAQSDASREQRTQFLLGTMAACEIICIGPLMVLRATKDRIWRYFRLSTRRCDSDNQLEAQRSMENSITQENTTATLDLESKQTTHKTAHVSRAKYKTNPNSHASPGGSKTKKVANRSSLTRTKNKNEQSDKNRHTQIHLSDEVNNSCSNITANTYINGNEVSTSSGIGLELENNIQIEQKTNCDLESVYSGVSSDRFSHRSHDMLSETGNLLLRRESSSTYERDMDIIDLLERERSMDLQEVIERERRVERVRKKPSTARSNAGVERHLKLPDIAKITAPGSPKRINNPESTSFPNFVFTHQFNEFAEARNNRNRDSNCANVSPKSRNNSQTSFGKRNSDAHQWNEEEITAGIANRVTRAPSIDSRKSSIKSVRDTRILNGNNFNSGTYANNL